MATTTPVRISPDEYRHTSYRPGCDYVEGVIEERNFGGWIETTCSTDATTGLRLDLAALFASIDDALGDPGAR